MLSNITNELSTIQNGRYGEDIRSAIHDAIEKVNNNTIPDVSGKVDKVEGKWLSTEDYTTAEKAKLNGIAAGAEVNSITGVKGDSESSYRVGNVSISKANVGLSNVDNTSDMNKPISTATQNALNLETDHIQGTTQSATVVDGFVTKILHKSGNDIIRTDTFSRNGDILTEVRTLAGGDQLTIVIDLSTGDTTVTKGVAV